MSQKIMGYPVVIDDRVNGWELVPPHTIEYRHILAAIPGDTNRHKLAWVQNAAAGIYACACGGNCDNGADAAARAMSKALGEIEAVIADVTLGIDNVNGKTPLEQIADIVEGIK